jgi:hypothetical protein
MFESYQKCEENETGLLWVFKKKFYKKFLNINTNLKKKWYSKEEICRKMTLIEIIEYHSDTILITIRIVFLLYLAKVIIYVTNCVFNCFNSIRLNYINYSNFNKKSNANYKKILTTNKNINDQTADVCKELENYLNELSNFSYNDKKVK